MINKIKLIILSNVLGLFLFPLGVSAIPLSTTQQAQVNWFWVNATGCSVANNYTSPSPVGVGGSLGQANAGSIILSTLTPTAGAWYQISCTSDPASTSAGAVISAIDYLTVTQAAPTLAPTLSISPSSGTTRIPFNLNWTASNNNPTDYRLSLVSQVQGAAPGNPFSLGNVLTWTITSAFDMWGTDTPDVHSFTIKACNASGCSPASNTVTFTASAPTTPTVKVNLGFLDKAKSSLYNIFTEIKNINLIDKTFAYTIK